jgi:phosphoglycolate phosphatase-like HAD superfamily hydrolase
MELVVFDIDGTLVDRHPKDNDAAYAAAIREVLGIITPKDWDEFKTSTDSGVLNEMALAQLGRPCTDSELAAVRTSMLRWLGRIYGDDPFVANPGSRDILQRLSAQTGFRTAIATGNWEFAGRFKLANAGIRLGEEPFASADDGIYRREILSFALSRSAESGPFTRVTYVGDWIWDVKAAQDLGWNFIGFATKETELALRQAGATNIIQSLEDLPQALAAPPSSLFNLESR